MYRRRRPILPAAEPAAERPTGWSERIGRKNGINLLFGAFGLLPLWLSICFLITIGPMALWFAPFAIAVCGVTIGIAAATVAIYDRTPGTSAHKFAVARAWFIALVLLAIAVAAYFGWRSHRETQVLQQEQARALAFVQNHPEVIAAAGGEVTASLATGTGAGPPFRYEFYVSAPKKLHVIIGVTRSAAGPTFTLVCFPVLPFGKRVSHVDDCLQ